VDNFGDLLGGLGDMIGGIFGGSEAGEGVAEWTDFFLPDDRRREDAPESVVYERYLCGGPRKRNINDR
jgi:hypothetical protein